MFQIHLNVCHLGYIILTLLLAKQLMLFNLAHFVRSLDLQHNVMSRFKIRCLPNVRPEFYFDRQSGKVCNSFDLTYELATISSYCYCRGGCLTCQLRDTWPMFSYTSRASLSFVFFGCQRSSTRFSSEFGFHCLCRTWTVEPAWKLTLRLIWPIAIIYLLWWLWIGFLSFLLFLSHTFIGKIVGLEVKKIFFNIIPVNSSIITKCKVVIHFVMIKEDRTRCPDNSHGNSKYFLWS